MTTKINIFDRSSLTNNIDQITCLWSEFLLWLIFVLLQSSAINKNNTYDVHVQFLNTYMEWQKTLSIIMRYSFKLQLISDNKAFINLLWDDTVWQHWLKLATVSYIFVILHKLTNKMIFYSPRVLMFPSKILLTFIINPF